MDTMAATIKILTIKSPRASQTKEQKWRTGSVKTLLDPKISSLPSREVIPFSISVFNSDNNFETGFVSKYFKSL